MTATLMTIASVSLITIMIVWATLKNKALPYCISDCYYIIGLPFTIVFSISSWLMLYPTMLCWESPVTLAMVMAFSLVGVASDFKSSLFRTAHFVSAIAAGCFSAIFVIKVCPSASLCYIAVIIGLLDKKRWLLWVEIGCLLSVFVAVLYALNHNNYESNL